MRTTIFRLRPSSMILTIFEPDHFGQARVGARSTSTSTGPYATRADEQRKRPLNVNDQLDSD